MDPFEHFDTTKAIEVFESVLGSVEGNAIDMLINLWEILLRTGIEDGVRAFNSTQLEQSPFLFARRGKHGSNHLRDLP